MPDPNPDTVDAVSNGPLPLLMPLVWETCTVMWYQNMAIIDEMWFKIGLFDTRLEMA
jgi:hypothetical protein